jgi:hypothetical protein
MAIDSRGQVTTTGLMNQGASRLQVPDMSNLIQPEQPKQTIRQPEQPVRTDQATTAQKGRSNAITDEDMAVSPT